MRVLVLNHFFENDIEALRRAATSDDVIDILDYQHLRHEAIRVLPPGVEDGLEAFAAIQGTPAHAAWVRRLRAILGYEIRRSRCDVVVTTTDEFFYGRDFHSICADYGVPWIVVVKETTLTDATFGPLADAVRRWAVPVADARSVCSDRQREFWIRSGADPASVHVLGQPRFDSLVRLARDDVAGRRRPTVVFFSYQLGAYHPSGGYGESPDPVWAPLHEATIEGLREVAAAGWRVLIKPHPQQDVTQLPGFRSADACGDMRVVPASVNSMDLIAQADVVVGFQSTVLIEAGVAGRPVLYTGWDRRERELRDRLIRFDEASPAVVIVEDPRRLAAMIRDSLGRRHDAEARRRMHEFAEEHLGRIDGFASDRVWEFLRHQRRGSAPTASAPVWREQVPYLLRKRARSVYLARRRRADARIEAAVLEDPASGSTNTNR